MPTLVVLHPDGTETEHPFEGELGIGRQEDNGLVLPEGGVSRRHARLRAGPQGALLEDVGSANGTYVDGERLEAPCVLGPGTEVQLGGYVLRLQPDWPRRALRPPGPCASAGEPCEQPLTLARVDGPCPDARLAEVGGSWAGSALLLEGTLTDGVPGSWQREAARTAASRRLPDGSAPEARPRRLALAGVALLGLLLLAALVRTRSGPGAEPMEALAFAAEAESAPQVQALLRQCRSFASTEPEAEPDWRRAEGACGQALDLDPLQPEAHALLQRIRLEREAAQHFAHGEKALARLKEEEALDHFANIPKESVYFRRARPRVREASAQVASRALDDCRRYLRDAQWRAAVPRCERYFGVACQRMKREALEPPLGHRVVLASGRLRANEWRPPDPLLVRFLAARQRLGPQAAPWTCPPAEMLAEEPETADPKVAVAEAFARRHPDPLLRAALLDYWSGRSTEAVGSLQKLRSDSARAPHHAEANAALRDLSTVDQLFKAGGAALQGGDVERASGAFREALELDGRVMAGLATTHPSFYRRAIQQDMASHAYAAGKRWADRADARRGCRVWKLGFGFYAGNSDLNRAVGFCSMRGLALLDAARACEDLGPVADFAVQGDGLQERLEAKRAGWACP